MFPFSIITLLVTLLLVVSPSEMERSAQSRTEEMVRNFLSPHGEYMAIYFSDVDTAFTILDDDSVFHEVSERVKLYQDSTYMFSKLDFSKADSFYEIYKKYNLRKDSIRIHYQPQPLGWFIIHHFEFDGKLWTDSFMVDFDFKNIIKVKQAIE